MTLTYYACSLGVVEVPLRCYERLVEVSGMLGVPAPPPLELFGGSPALVDEWAERYGLSAEAGL